MKKSKINFDSIRTIVFHYKVTIKNWRTDKNERKFQVKAHTKGILNYSGIIGLKLRQKMTTFSFEN